MSLQRKRRRSSKTMLDYVITLLCVACVLGVISLLGFYFQKSDTFLVLLVISGGLMLAALLGLVAYMLKELFR